MRGVRFVDPDTVPGHPRSPSENRGDCQRSSSTPLSGLSTIPSLEELEAVIPGRVVRGRDLNTPGRLVAHKPAHRRRGRRPHEQGVVPGRGHSRQPTAGRNTGGRNPAIMPHDDRPGLAQAGVRRRELHHRRRIEPIADDPLNPDMLAIRVPVPLTVHALLNNPFLRSLILTWRESRLIGQGPARSTPGSAAIIQSIQFPGEDSIAHDLIRRDHSTRRGRIIRTQAAAISFRAFRQSLHEDPAENTPSRGIPNSSSPGSQGPGLMSGFLD